MEQTVTKIKDTTNNNIIEPGKYKVVIYNDDVTPVEFVIAILMKIFGHAQEPATELTLKIHNEGSAVAGVYRFEVAEQKGVESTNISRQNGYPLVIKVEAE